MNDKNIFDALRDIDPQWILDAAPQKRTSTASAWVKWGALAACLCILMVGIFYFTFPKTPDAPIPNESTPPAGTEPPIVEHVHAFGEWQTTKDATCAEAGEEMRLCACGEKEIKYTALLPHFAGEWVVEKEPTIKVPTPDDPTEREPGLKCQFCERCGAKLDEELIPATGSLGLAYAINPDGKTFAVAGIGNCTDEDIIIPENFCGYHVTSIMKDAFKNSQNVKSVTLPETLTSIGDSAFRSCGALESVVLPEGLLEIGEIAFGTCYSLQSITLPSTLTTIGRMAFSECSKISSIVVPDGVTALEQSVFRGCSKLESITLPAGLKSIGSNAFYGCRELKSIDIPSGVISIGEYAFYFCSALTEIVLPEGLEAIEAATFYDCANLIGITIPQGVKTIGENAFRYCSSLVSIDIPAGVTFIGGGAFMDCWELKQITLPEGLKSIENSTFYNCVSLSELNIPNSVTRIFYDAFENCLSLIQVQNGVSYVDDWAVAFDFKQTAVDFRDGTVGIADRTFWFSATLTRVNIPNSVKHIGMYAFVYIDSLKLIVFNGTKEEWEAVEKNEYWDQSSENYYLVCANGVSK